MSLVEADKCDEDIRSHFRISELVNEQQVERDRENTIVNQLKITNNFLDSLICYLNDWT